MLPDTAIELINTVTYRPGWTLKAEDHTKRFADSVCVRVTYLAPETGRNNWPEYTETIQARASFAIQVHDCNDPVSLYRKVLDGLLSIEIHEARELFRVQPIGWAPFHPHTTDGMDVWGDPHGDLLFGLV